MNKIPSGGKLELIGYCGLYNKQRQKPCLMLNYSKMKVMTF